MEAKRLSIIFVAIVMFLQSYADHEVTKFLGFSVDGSKQSVAENLVAKGFVNYAYDEDAFDGWFNGEEVRAFIIVNKDKVYRICLVDKDGRDWYQIKLRFNKLCEQFETNSKYESLKDYKIPIDRNILPHDLEKGKYQAIYFQKASDGSIDTNRQVWFKISKYDYDEYRISMYYDNIYNMANGEDL